MQQKLLKANQDESVFIKESDRFGIHVRLTRLSVNPKDPLNINRVEQIKCFPVATFEKLEAMRYQKNPLVWYVAGGFKELKIVHDGRLELKPEIEAPTEGDVLARKQKEADARKQKRLQNLAAARAVKAANNA